MWCPNCNEEYAGRDRCPVCGEELREIPKLSWGDSSKLDKLKSWPVNERGERVNPVFLAHRSCVDMEADMLIAMLEAYKIPCIPTHPNNGEFSMVIFGMSAGGSDIFVPETMLEDAKALIEGVEYDS